MPRALKIDRPKPITVNVPESIMAKVRQQLYSDIECKIPHGAISDLVTEQLREWLKSRGVVV